LVMAHIMDPEPGMEIYDPCCGSAGLLIKCDLVLQEKMNLRSRKTFAPAKLYGQENEPGTWAMANRNMIIHDMEGEIQIGDTFRKPKFRTGNRLRTFDRVVANPMWNQTEFKEKDYDADELDRFPKGAGYPGGKADWGWMQHILASLKPNGRAAVVLDTGAASRGSGNMGSNKERDVRRWFVEQDLIEGVIYLPEDLFYNTPSPGIIIVLSKAKHKERQGRLLLLNAGREFEKGDPKNFIPDESIVRIAKTITLWREVEKYSRIVTLEEIAKNDFNISPNRYIHTGEADEYRPIAEIVDDLDTLEAETVEVDEALKSILKQFAV
ncbi:MAG: N-6 DNA methylase, partial [Pyrinomonadaceae bacterium]